MPMPDLFLWQTSQMDFMIVLLTNGKVPQYALKSDGQLDSEFFQIEAVA